MNGPFTHRGIIARVGNPGEPPERVKFLTAHGAAKLLLSTGYLDHPEVVDPGDELEYFMVGYAAGQAVVLECEYGEWFRFLDEVQDYLGRHGVDALRQEGGKDEQGD